MTSKEERWLTCAQKRCCWTTIVYPTGADIHRIATALFVPPWHFTAPLSAPDDAPDGFALDRSKRRYRAALAKGAPLRDGAAPCVFLIATQDGTARCGLGDLRPGPCKSFPSYLIDGELAVAQGVCTCREWSVDDIDDPAREKALLMAEADERATYARVIQNWNAFVADNRDDDVYEYADFCRYLLDAYAQMAHATV